MKKYNVLLCLVLLMVQLPAFAYIGPGAGIPFIGSFLGFVVSIILVISAILFWPIRKLLKKKKSKPTSEDDNKQ
jgi:membrane protein implicated in regulation of membrane protease activity